MSTVITGLKLIGTLYFIRLYNEYLAYAFIIFVLGTLVEQGIIMYQKAKALNEFLKSAQEAIDKRNKDD